MRLFVFIFSTYLLALSIMPCTDMQNGQDDRSSHQLEQTRDNHSDSSDLCSPFCLCSCCGTVSENLLQFEAFDFSKAKTNATLQLTSYYNPYFIAGFYGNIWQPPKVNS